MAWFGWKTKRGRQRTAGVEPSAAASPQDPLNALKHVQKRIQEAYEENIGRRSLENTGRLRLLGRSGGQESQQESEERQREILSQIAVLAFVGPSGTGKSTRALSLAAKHQIAYIIDDGLLIHGSRILAGTSAKRAPTKLESVRQALFSDPQRARSMRRVLAEQQPATLMILGTSDNMLEKICKALHLNPPSMLIRIEDVTTEEERHQARKNRLTEGQHTIPVPSMEIKHEFSGYFSEPISRLRSRLDRDRQAGGPGTERTVVRPTFSILGSYSISDEALRHMLELLLGEIPGVAALENCRITKEVYGVSLDLELALYFGYSAQSLLAEVQARVASSVERYTAINILAVNVRATAVWSERERREERRCESL